jgi:hypothetical protein
MTREFILNRIEEMKRDTGGFPTSTQRWSNLFFGSSQQPAAVFNFKSLSDKDLVIVFEKLIKRYHTQM